MGIYKRPDSKKWWISYYLNGERVREEAQKRGQAKNNKTGKPHTDLKKGW
jgi:hypothetical protein